MKRQARVYPGAPVLTRKRKPSVLSRKEQTMCFRDRVDEQFLWGQTLGEQIFGLGLNKQGRDKGKGSTGRGQS